MKLYWLTLIALGLFSNLPVYADDTEIYVSRKPQAAPNVIFVMDTSGSMGSRAYDENGNYEGTRLEVVQDVAVDVINNTTGINIAIMRFDRKKSYGGWLSSPMLPIDQEGVRSMVHDVLYSYTAAGATPITETLAEAAAYLRGDPLIYSTAINTENTDLCMTWEEQLVPVTKSGKSSSVSGLSRSLGSVDSSKTSKATIDTSAWWFQLAKDDPWLLRAKLIDVNTMTWIPWNKLETWVKQSLKKTHNIKKTNYGTGSPEWWMKTDGWFYTYFRNPNTGEFTLWDNLENWHKRFLTQAYGITEAEYRANTEVVAPPDPDPEPDPEPEYELKLVCVENLNLDDAHDGKGNWISPITDECQSNHIVLFSDGSPTADSGVNTLAKNLLKKLPSKDFPSYEYFSQSCSGNGGCAEELAYAYHNLDNADHLDGTQAITIHTIGGFIGGRTQDRMNDIAHFGGGIAQEGSNSAELRSALKKVFDSISSTSGSFSAPALTVNAYNSLEHSDQLYYSLFKPEVDAAWGGNLKRYKLGSDGKVLDDTGLPAIDPSSGYFSQNATSLWTLAEDAPDGDKVALGGAARRLEDPTSRKVVTYMGSSKNLLDSTNRISTNNPKINNKDLFNSNANDDNFEKMLQWAQGYETASSDATDGRRSMEDPLHSRPVLVNYGTRSVGGENIADSSIFVGTNSGYLHAFDTNENNPDEEFAFIPRELLPNITAYYERDTEKVYGLDGQLTVYHNDENSNRIVDSGEKAYLYAGMRRGGRSYYALDISKRGAPKYMWQINGGEGDFIELGQTWSKMVLATVVWKGKAKKVILFGGGYDTAEDSNTSRKEHSMGNAIFMVDPETGKLLWKASNDSGNLRLADMTSGIVGDIVPVDDDGDGDTDILYAADLGGRIWRIDFIEENSGSVGSFAKGGLIADLGSDDTTVNHVRFYNTPDVIYSTNGYFKNQATGKLEKKGRYQIAIGSGYRAHPLNNDTVDNIFIVNDFDVTGAPKNYTQLSKKDLANYSSYDSANSNQVANGLYYKLPLEGEKILSNSLTLNNVTYMVSYRPSNGESRSGCDPDIGYAKAYTIKPRYYEEYVDNSGNKKTRLLAPATSDTDLKSPGIPPAPIFVRPPTPKTKEEVENHVTAGIMVRTEVLEVEGSGKLVERSYWREY